MTPRVTSQPEDLAGDYLGSWFRDLGTFTSLNERRLPHRATQRFAPGEKVPASWKVGGKQGGVSRFWASMNWVFWIFLTAQGKGGPPSMPGFRVSVSWECCCNPRASESGNRRGWDVGLAKCPQRGLRVFSQDLKTESRQQLWNIILQDDS